MGRKKRNHGSHSKQSNAKSSDHTKGDTEEPREEGSVQAKGSNEINKVYGEYMATMILLGGIPESSHQRVTSYWKTLSIDSKKDSLKIRVENLRHQFRTPETGLLEEFITSIVLFFDTWKSWKAWICFLCSEMYADSGSYLLHVREEHMGCIPHEGLPQIVDKEWIEEFNDCSWEPLDASAAIIMLEKQAKSEEASIPKACCWPLSNDSERAKFLKVIKRELMMLIRHKYFAGSHLSWLMRFAKDKISGLADGSQILNHALGQSLYCICFLGVPELKEMYKFLLELTNACGLVISADKGINPPDDLHNSNQIPMIKEEILLNEDASCLLLDESLLLTPSTFESAALNDVINKDPFLSWLLSASCLEQWAFWHRKKSNNAIQQTNFVKALQVELDELQEHCKMRSAVTNYDKALKFVDDLCLEEGKKRENFTESVPRMRKEERSNSEEHVGNTFELDAITNALEQAQVINANQPGYEKNSTGAYDLESKMDSYFRTAIEQKKGTQLNKLCEIDVRILINIAEMKQLQAKLAYASVYDLREPLLPLMKTYLKTRLDDLAAQYANDALLAELATESEKGAKGRSDSAKHKGKAKTMKKNKENIKTKTMDLKVGSIMNDEQHVLDTTTADHPSAAHDKKKRLAERLKEIEAKKKSLAEQKKKLDEVEEVRLTVEIEEKKEKVAEKQKHLTLQQIELEDEEGRFRIEIQEKKAKLAKGHAQLAHQQKQQEDEEERLRIEIQEKKAELAKKHAQLAQQKKQLGDEEGRHRIEIQEKKAKLKIKHKQTAQQKKELEEEEEWLGYEIEEKIAKLEEKQTHLAHQQKELEEEEEMTKIELEKQDEEVIDPVE